MTAGRKPLPPEIHELNGNPSKKNLEELKARQLKPDPSVPGCPAWLDGTARTEWRRIAPKLAELGLLTQNDRSALACYCDAWSQLVAARKVIIRYGSTVEITKRGVVVDVFVRPEVKMAEKARDQIRQMCAEFGLTPSSRSRMIMPGKPDEAADPMEKIMSEANAKARKVLK